MNLKAWLNKLADDLELELFGAQTNTEMLGVHEREVCAASSCHVYNYAMCAVEVIK